MEIKDRLKEIKEKLDDFDQQQDQLLAEYEKLINEFENSNFIQENQVLKEELEQSQKLIGELEEEQQNVVAENQKLKSALQEQIVSEKLNILKISRKKLDTYFANQKDKFNNQLLALEEKAKEEINQAQVKCEQELIAKEEEYKERFAELYKELKEDIIDQKEKMLEKEKTIKQEVQTRMQELENEEVDQETMQKRMEQNQIEMKIGLNWVNKLGVLLILFGVIAGFKYSYSHWVSSWFNDYMKGIAFFLLGGGFIAGGEWFYRQKKEVFALGLLGGGISILYASIFYSYFLLGIMDLVVAFVVMMLVTFATIISALRYDSRTVCCLGLFGGYLTFITYAAYYHWFQLQSGLGVAMVYLLVLTIAVLIMSFKKRWILLNYISFFTNLPALVFLVLAVENEFLGIIYALLMFIIYLTIILAYPFKYKMSLKTLDVALLGINTMVNGVLLYNLLIKAGLDMLIGLVALIFCLVYLALGQFVQQKMTMEKHTLFLFYGTSLTFAVLMIPFQFGIQWLTIGWLVEGLILAVYGHRNQLKKLELGGLVIFVFCIVVFGLIDLPQALAGKGYYFDSKYFAVIIGQIILLAHYLVDIKEEKISIYSKQGRWINNYKYFVVANAWIYLLYLGDKVYDNLISITANSSFYYLLVIALISIGFAYLISKLKIIYDEVVKYFSIFLYLLGDIICLGINVALPVFLQPQSQALKWFSLLVLIVYNLFVFFNIKDLLVLLFKKERYAFEWFPVALSIYLLGVITSFLIVQFDLGGNNLLFSSIYLILAIAFIIYGFKHKFMYQRRLGLGMSLFATGKLFLYDLSFLGTGGKIIAYFIFGLILLAISFIYQKMKEFMEDYNVQDQI
ncbi:DUF2339 domain-containing protein [Sporohalobacter salinus]|uniref:DUF2339 domain-containing protein n=1 Tax=Sporohalobacter salinus TaxID=1494606 RepID=UPI00195F5A46|nr:DUF2339 domain-containing protein [Sporohalobacter salinus]MBM7624256.1 putative membrane protein [Sporohalobacter salinus]